MLARIEAQYALLTLRERVLVLAASLALILCGGWFLIAEPMYIQNTKLEQRITSSKKQIADLQNEVNSMQSQLKINPNELLQKSITEILQQNQQLKQELIKDHNLVLEPQAMTELIKAIMKKADSVSIVDMVSQPVEEIVSGDDKGAVALYKHPIELKVSGDFFQLKGFVKSLKELPYTVYWESAKYEVSKFPKGIVTIHFYSLALTKELLSV